jgi:hypothetical protein
MNTCALAPILAALSVLTGCTAINVEPLSPGIRTVHIRDNPKVTVPEFVDVMKDGFYRHGIAVQTLPQGAAAGDYYVVDYTARRTWDVVTFLSEAEITITHRGDRVGHAVYYLRGKGGFALTKYQDVDTKINPVMDELLARYPQRQSTSNP